MKQEENTTGDSDNIRPDDASVPNKLLELLRITLVTVTAFAAVLALTIKSTTLNIDISDVIGDVFIKWGINTWIIALIMIWTGLITANMIKFDQNYNFPDSTKPKIINTGWVNYLYKLSVTFVVLTPILFLFGIINLGAVQEYNQWEYTNTLFLSIIPIILAILIVTYVVLVKQTAIGGLEILQEIRYRCLTYPPNKANDRLSWMDKGHFDIISMIAEVGDQVRIDQVAIKLDSDHSHVRKKCNNLSENELIEIDRYSRICLTEDGKSLINRKYPFKSFPINFIRLYRLNLISLASFDIFCFLYFIIIWPA